MDKFNITISNWDKRQPRRKDQHSYPWFRLYNDFFRDESTFNLSLEEKAIFVYILSKASEKNSSTITCDIQHFSWELRCNTKLILSTIEKLIEYKLVTNDSHAYVTDPLQVRNGSVPLDKIRLDKIRINTCAIDIARKSKFDFEAIYKQYPRKLGKQKGLAKLQREIKTDEDFNSLQVALEKYKKHVVGNSIEPKFVQHFSTWVNSWRDWLDPDAGKTKIQSRTQEEWIQLLGADEYNKLTEEDKKRLDEI